MEWVLALIAVKLALALLLAAPVRLRAGLTGGDRMRWHAELGWLFARAGRDEGGWYWALGRLRRAFAPPTGEDGRVARSAGRGRRKWLRLAMRERRAVGRLAGEVWAAVDITARGDVSYGCRDPAATAWLHALYCAARGSGRLVELAARPDFTAAGWSGQADMVATVRPARLVLPAARFFARMILTWLADKRMGGKGVWQTQI